MLLTWFIAPWFTPLPRALTEADAGTPTLLDRHGRELASLADPRARVREPLPLSAMGRWLPAVTVALEDHRFTDHAGVDWRSLVGATWRNVRHGKIISGASTITQQLIKAGRPGVERGWGAKIYEVLAARRLEHVWSKDRILEEYLNRIDYGNRRIGPAAAAQAYFGKDPARLSLAEAIFLAGLPQSPTRFNPWRRADAAVVRYQRSVARLAEVGVIDAATSVDLRAASPAVLKETPEVEARHFVSALVQRHPEIRGATTTCLDLDLQNAIEVRVREHLARVRERDVTNAAVVVLDTRSGAIRALVGSAGWDDAAGQVNGALAPHSSGSILKPLLYAEAIAARRITAATVLADTDDAMRRLFPDYDPRNYDRSFQGPVRVREALASSLNVPAVEVLAEFGARKFFECLPAWGIELPGRFEDYGAGVVLGHAEVRLLDVAAAFGALANDGLRVEPRWLEDDPLAVRRVLAPGAGAIVADVLSDPEARVRSFGRRSPLETPFRVPVKTGTSSSFRDALTVGWTGRHVVAVWAGNFDGRPMDDAASIVAAAPLWRDVIDLLLPEDGGAPPVDGHADVVSVEVCCLSGLRPCAESPGIMREWFLRGTEPAESAAGWFETNDGGVVRPVLPASFAMWCASGQNFLGARAMAADALRIVQPVEGAVFFLENSTPRTQQAIRFRSNASSGANVIWSVDGVALASRETAPLWTLTAGEHWVEISDGVRRVRTQFRVD